MTEDEAKTKWCPFARDSETAGNRSQAAPDKIHFPCIASACMAWRAQRVSNFASKIQAIKNHRAEHGSSLFEAKNAVEATWIDAAVGGYCGLAGQPQ